MSSLVTELQFGTSVYMKANSLRSLMDASVFGAT